MTFWFRAMLSSDLVAPRGSDSISRGPVTTIGRLPEAYACWNGAPLSGVGTANQSSWTPGNGLTSFSRPSESWSTLFPVA